MSLATIQDLIKSGATTARAAFRCGRNETLALPALAAAHGETTTVEYPVTMGLGNVSARGGAR